jgi:mannose-6-phosphate isomerase
MNLIRLNEGEGIFQDPGVLHAYLEGQNIECMATSDNVVRGGLTTKHIDTGQLIKMVRFESTPPKVIKPQKISSTQLEYPVPTSEFGLKKITSSGPIKLGHKGLIINLGPTAYIRTDGSNLHLNHGEAALVDTLGTMQTMANATNEQKVNLYFAYSP